MRTSTLLAALFLIFFSGLAFAQSREKVLFVSLFLEDEKISFDTAFVQNGVFASELESGPVTGTIYSPENNELFVFAFDFEDEVAVEGIGVVKEKKPQKVLILPYFENAEKIVFFNKNTRQTLIASIGFLSNLCGNQSCDSSEAFPNCPVDCPSGEADSYCDRVADAKCDPDCSPSWMDGDCGQANALTALPPDEIDLIVSQKSGAEEQDYSTVLLGIGALALGIGFFMLKRRVK